MCGPLVPAVPSCILDPLREEFLALIPARLDRHPLGCHRRRIADHIVFDKIVEALVFGCGYERLADRTCSATTLRRRRDEWIAAGLFDRLRRSVLAACERLIGLDLADVSVDGCLTKAPCGGECAGRYPVDRAKLGLKVLPARRRQRGAAHRAARAGPPPRPSAAAGPPRRLGRAARAGRRRSSPDDGAPGRRL